MRLPAVSRRECVRALQRAGFEVVRMSGDHFVMRRPDGHRTSVPDANTLQKGTMSNILRMTQISIEEFTRLRKGKASDA